MVDLYQSLHLNSVSTTSMSPSILTTGQSSIRSTLSQIHLLISKISHVCQEICDIKEARKPKSNLLEPNYTNTSLDEGQRDWNYTQGPDSNNSAKENTGDEDDRGGTYSAHSTLCPHEPSNPDNPSHHAPVPPSPNPPPSEAFKSLLETYLSLQLPE